VSPLLERVSNSAFGFLGSTGPAGAFESIASASGTGSSGTITFSSIPSTYQHLQIRGIARTTTGNNLEWLNMRFNSDTSSAYDNHYLSGDGSSASATSFINASYIEPALAAASSSPSNTLNAFIIDIHDYASTSKNKTTRSITGIERNQGDTDSRIHLLSGLWRNTNAISSITLFTRNSGNFTTQTQIALYGIKGA
jgi:hypothetical protein